MEERIRHELETIQHEHDVTIVYACESGSRAWGFPSSDSDYDVRFVYCHPRDWYLSVGKRPEVIEHIQDSVLDIVGWDVRKAIYLLRKSNMSVVEWFGSPIVYLRRDDPCQSLQEVISQGFSPTQAARHYLSMARTNIQSLNKPNVALKTYLYAIRPLLCCRWILERDEVPPVPFQTLVDTFLDRTEVALEIDRVLSNKQATRERDLVVRRPVLDEYVQSEYSRLFAQLPTAFATPDVEPFNRAFRAILESVENGGSSSHSLVDE